MVVMGVFLSEFFEIDSEGAGFVGEACVLESGFEFLFLLFEVRESGILEVALREVVMAAVVVVSFGGDKLWEKLMVLHSVGSSLEGFVSLEISLWVVFLVEASFGSGSFDFSFSFFRFFFGLSCCGEVVKSEIISFSLEGVGESGSGVRFGFYVGGSVVEEFSLSFFMVFLA